MIRQDIQLNKLNQNHIDAINKISDFLAVQDRLVMPIDLVVVLGSAMIHHLKQIGERYHQGHYKKIMVVGGIGHSTAYLYENLDADKSLRAYVDTSLSEAEIYANILSKEYRVPSTDIVIEPRSTNCGNNATYAFELAKAIGLKPTSILLIQDPTMQRRSHASFLHEWHDHQVTWYNWAPFQPVLEMNDEGQVFFQGMTNPPWSIERFIELVMGEIPRLRDDKNGYGPLGRDFIKHVDIPKPVLEAYEQLRYIMHN